MPKEYVEQTLFNNAEKKCPVECLGMTFESDEKRREYFLEKLCQRLKDPKFREIEGFPIGSDEDILALSDPPYYTACPNPFIGDFIKYYGKPYDPNKHYNRKPFAIDVSEGKTDPIYKAHSYHTKVPHLAIVPYILHYTEPDDIVLDGFCGSGMTGVASQWCGTAPVQYRQKIELEWAKQGLDKPKWGLRRVILNDLAPAATFIASNYNLPFDVDTFEMAGRKLLSEVEQELGWMYETIHTDGKTKGQIEYMVWSEVFTCPDCAGEIVFLDEAFDQKTKRVKETFLCPHCKSELNKQRMNRCYGTSFDEALSTTIKIPKRRPSLISYRIGESRFEKQPDHGDLNILEEISKLPFPALFPTDRMMHAPESDDCWGDKWRSGTASFSHVHYLFLTRPAHTLAALWNKANAYPARIRHILLFFVEQAIWGMSLLARYTPTHFSQVNQYLSGVYYVASQHSECSPWYILDGKLARLSKAFQSNFASTAAATITTGTASSLGLPDDCIDYIFTDPPFGDNLAYAELNFVVESFHKCFTNMEPEAIVSDQQQKGLTEYQNLMYLCFAEYYRTLKPGHWMTVVFHNSRNSVWTAIQEALQQAGFVVADVRVLDKQQESFNQSVAIGSVKQDLVISAYKPNGGLEDRFKLTAGTEGGAWDFVCTHLKQLPVFVAKGCQAEVITERQNYLLFDRMVAFHIQRGATVPLSAAEFYQGLVQRFSERDSMYFLPDQVAEYDKKWLTCHEVLQLQIFVTDESSAIQWLKQQLTTKPQTFQELQPQFMQETQGGWQKYEKPLELSELLQQNFLIYDGNDEVSTQIYNYFSSNFKELNNMPKDDPDLRAKAKNRWYVPDPNRAADLEKLRERALLREFEEYRESKQRRLKVFRLEAVRAGFKKAWQERDYATIIAVADKIPENVLQEDPKLLMWYDQALTRIGDNQF